MAPLPTSVPETATTIRTAPVLLQNGTVAAGNVTFAAQEIFEPGRDGHIALSIMGLIAVFFFGMLIKDVYNKKRTGELREEAVSCGTVLFAIITLPFLVFNVYNAKWLWITFSNLFRAEENKIILEKKSEDDSYVLNPRYDSEEVIARLGGGWPPKRPLVTTESASPEDDTTPYSDKDPGPGRLPSVTEVSLDPDHATPTDRGLPLIGTLPVVFEVPEIVPASVGGDAGFETVVVFGSSSGANRDRVSNPDVIAESGPSRHENPLGVDSNEGSSAQNQNDGGSNSPSHERGSGSGFFSFIRGHRPDSSSSNHSHGHGHDHGPHSYGHSHADNDHGGCGHGGDGDGD